MWISAGSSSDKIVGCSQATGRMLRMTKFLMNMLQTFGPSSVLVHPHEPPATAGPGSDAAWLRKAFLSVSTMGACSIDNIWRCGWRIGARVFALGTAKDEVLAFNVRPRSGASVRTRRWFVLWVWPITKTGGTLWLAQMQRDGSNVEAWWISTRDLFLYWYSCLDLLCPKCPCWVDPLDCLISEGAFVPESSSTESLFWRTTPIDSRFSAQ